MKRILILAFAVTSLIGSTAGANPLRSEDANRVRSLSSELAVATERLYETVSQRGRRDDLRAQRMLRRLAELESASRFFRREVNLPDSDLADSRAEFDRVVAAYTPVSAELDDEYAQGPVAVAFDEVERAMAELTDLYGGQAQYWGRRDRRSGPTVTVPAYTTVPVRLRTAIRSRDLRNGQEIGATLADDLVVHGRTVAPRGAEARIRVVELDKAGKVQGKESLTLELASLAINGRLQPVDSSTVTLRAHGSEDRDVGVVAGSAAVGALIGALTGGGDDAAKGALIGGAAGTGVVLSTRGKTVRLDAGTRLDFSLTSSLRVRTPGSIERDRIEEGGGISRR